MVDGPKKIVRHEARTTDRDLVPPLSPNLEAITAHIEKHLGAPATVFHELVSELVHVDIHIVAPTAERNYYTLVTSGMSDRAMNVPANFETRRFAELVICLPGDWPMEHAAWKDERNYWPIRLLKVLARFPHQYSTWLGVGHTVPNGNFARRYAANTRMCCALLLPPILAPQDFWMLHVDPQTVINFYGVFPLYRQEMRFNLRHGRDPLCHRLADHAVSELLDVNRVNVCKKRFGFFR